MEYPLVCSMSMTIELINNFSIYRNSIEFLNESFHLWLGLVIFSKLSELNYKYCLLCILTNMLLRICVTAKSNSKIFLVWISETMLDDFYYSGVFALLSSSLFLYSQRLQPSSIVSCRTQEPTRNFEPRSFIWSTGAACSDFVYQNWVQVLFLYF